MLRAVGLVPAWLPVVSAGNLLVLERPVLETVVVVPMPEAVR